MSKDEQARFEKAVMEEVEKRLAEQQATFAHAMETAIKSSLNQIDKGNEVLEKERIATLIEREKQMNLRKEIEDKADQMAEDYFHGRQKQFREAAHTELLRGLVWRHLEAGKPMREIAIWLDVPMKFVKDIHTILERKREFRAQYPEVAVPDGNPKLRYQDYGRGGTIWYESVDTTFDMWWEFAGGDAMVIVDVPPEDKWEERTKLPKDQREVVLTYIAVQLLKDKNAGTGTFHIGHNVITFYA